MLEPVIAITFFAIISVFLLRIFASTEKIRSTAEETSKAVIKAESVMEYLLAANEEDGKLAQEGFKIVSEGGKTSFVKYYDKDWTVTDDTWKYEVVVVVNGEDKGAGKLMKYEVSINKNNKGTQTEVYTLSAKKYMSGGEGL